MAAALNIHSDDSTRIFYEERGSIVSMSLETAPRTVAVPLVLSQDALQALDATVGDYNQAWGMVVAWCKQAKSTNRTRLQKQLYAVLRETFPHMPSQFASRALKYGAAAVKSWNSNNPGRRWQVKARRKARSLPYDLRTMSLRGHLLALSTRVGSPRARTLVEVPAWFEQRYPDAALTAGTLHLDGPHINLVFNIPQNASAATGKIVGIDRGIYKLVSTSEGGEYDSKQERAAQRKYLHNRKVLQQVGTRSAHRRLQAMSGREKRYKQDINHQISKRLASAPDVAVYVLEDLTGVRQQWRYGKLARSWLHKWSFAQLAFDIEYKCRDAGIKVEYVPPEYTSRRCSRCGYVSKANRFKSRFSCRRCGYEDNADKNAALNIKNLYLSRIEPGAGPVNGPIERDAPPKPGNGKAGTQHPRSSLTARR
jgi:IS605 OrfB family transposase